jgi:release factor glutamine methyltransferase
VVCFRGETIQTLLETGARELQRAGVPSPELDARLLLEHVLGISREQAVAHADAEAAPDRVARYRTLLRRRVAREPLPYILGHWHFYGRILRVSPAVLIPRPETELVVEAALALPAAKAAVLDVGTGSGCIAVSVALERPEWRVIAVDSSPAALEVARGNAHRLGAAIETREAAFPSGVADLAGQIDLIVANPPYVSAADANTLPPEVRLYEPAEALFAAEDGRALLRALAEAGPALLRPGGWLITEVGAGQAAAIASLLERTGWQEVRIAADLAGIDRVVAATYRP